MPTTHYAPTLHPARDQIIADLMRQKEAEKRCQEIADAIARRNGGQRR